MKGWGADTFKALKPITEAQIRYAREMSAKFILVENKQGEATCTRCESKIMLPNTKHKSKAICPNCHKEMDVRHVWRMSKNESVINWVVIAKVVNNSLVLRYVEAHSYGASDLIIKERARTVVTEGKEAEYYCYYDSKWNIGRRPYFNVPSYICPNAHWCMNADEYKRTYFREINKLSCFKYQPISYDWTLIPDQVTLKVKYASLIEKLSKVGMEKIAEPMWSNYSYHSITSGNTLPVNLKATKLVDMLKIDKERLNMLKEDISLENLKYLQSHKGINADTYRLHKKIGFHNIKSYTDYAKSLNVSLRKFSSYFENQGTSMWEWRKYCDYLKALDYDMHDTSYVLPKDFHKEFDRVEEEWMKKFAPKDYKKKLEERRLEEAKNEVIRAIKEKIHSMPELQQFFNGSNGYMVTTPASVDEFREEGRKQHNCVGRMGYDNRVAEGKTLIFFIRKVNDPTASFVTMEYCHGAIVQCMYDHNQRVEHEAEVYQFAEAFTNVLRAKKILSA